MRSGSIVSGDGGSGLAQTMSSAWYAGLVAADTEPFGEANLERPFLAPRGKQEGQVSCLSGSDRLSQWRQERNIDIGPGLLGPQRYEAVADMLAAEDDSVTAAVFGVEQQIESQAGLCSIGSACSYRATSSSVQV